MKKYVKFFYIGLATALISSLTFTSCKDDLPIDEEELLDYALGWLGDQENLAELESDINLFESGSSTNTKTSVDLSNYFPPIGNQGSYGTCVAWACGYNLKTFLEGRDKGYTATDLMSESNQFSPKDLFLAIPSAEKGADCNGTGFEYALDVMVSRGVAKMSTSPYTGLGDCTSSPTTEQNNEANQYKLNNYRKVDISVSALKDYLADERPVIIGAKLGDYFMNWNSDDVLTSDNDTYNGQHAYHAMILSGYDDNKNAFRVVNSWGTNWGDAGFIWVDYDFFVGQFCFAAFVASNLNSDSNYDPEGVNNVSGYDLIGWELTDFDNASNPDQTARICGFNVYNIGENAIPSSMDWNIVYLCYNAYDANEYYILLYDYYTDDYGAGVGDLGAYDPNSGRPGLSGNWYNNLYIPSGSSVSDIYFDTVGTRYDWYYNMPTSINGQYYLVLIADGYDVIDEYDETNNYFYFAKENGDPFTITNGIIDDSGAKSLKAFSNQKPVKGDKSPFGTVKTKTNINTYTPQEIGQMLDNHRKSGELQRRVNAFISENGTSVKRMHRK